MNRNPKTINFWYGHLPHWEVEDGRYFITLHVAGAIPRFAKQQIRSAAEEQRKKPSSQSAAWLRLQRKVFTLMEQWLDRVGHNSWLKDLAIAEMLAEAIETRQRSGMWNVFSSIIMPNHLHLFTEIPNGNLKSTLEDFKRWTGHQATKLMPDPPRRIWQKEWFDHWSRSDEQDDRINIYIKNNPTKARLERKFSQSPYYLSGFK